MNCNLYNLHLNAHNCKFLHYNDAKYYMRWTDTSISNKVIQHTFTDIFIYISHNLLDNTALHPNSELFLKCLE